MVAEVTQSHGTDFYLMDELLTAEERAVRDKVRAFCEKEVIPIINDYWERAEFPFELVPKSGSAQHCGDDYQGLWLPWNECDSGGVDRVGTGTC